jgi:glycosyltransferase involved in cell wall biosynthesis
MRKRQLTIFVAATHTARSRARTGIQTVVRGLVAGLNQVDVNLHVVGWSKWGRTLMPLKLKEKNSLGISECTKPILHDAVAESWLLLPEVLYGWRANRIIRFARNRGMRVAAIFHDAIPISHSHLVRREAVKWHAHYMKALCGADLVIAVSDFAERQFRAFAESHRQRLPRLTVCRLPDEWVGQKHCSVKNVDFSCPVKILCVSTLEPRKNHKTLLEAFELACAAISKSAHLYLVGDRHKDAEFIVNLVECAVAQNPGITWHGKVSDDQLSNLYRDCAFTVYPSLVEGFGLPIVESLWHWRPCICANFGEMAEIAKDGGCLTCDVRDPLQLSHAMVALATQPALRERLINEIERRKHKTWAEYAAEICENLGNASRISEESTSLPLRSGSGTFTLLP